MTDSRRPFDKEQPEPIDDDEDRMGSVHELDFDEEEPGTRIGDLTPERELAQKIPDQRARKAGMTGATNDNDVTDDDLSPETLIREDGQADWELRIVDEDDIGGGDGLDEAELARQDPLDGKP
jgi:hypothetical protein